MIFLSTIIIPVSHQQCTMICFGTDEGTLEGSTPTGSGKMGILNGKLYLKSKVMCFPLTILKVPFLYMFNLLKFRSIRENVCTLDPEFKD